MIKFRKAIQVGGNATDILKLPCVTGCYKYPIYDPSSKFPLRGHIPSKGEIIYHFRQGGIDDFVMIGDWLCEDESGVWTLLSDKEYKEWQQSKNLKKG